jgi:hypothetical protein
MSIAAVSNGHVAVSCLCGATGPKEKNKEDAIRAWNTRDQHLLWNPFRLSIRFPKDMHSVDFKGTLESFDLATVLQMLAAKEKTGILYLSKGHTKSTICLKNGNIIAASDSNGMRLGQILFKNGMISQKKLKEALKASKDSGKMLGEVLLFMKYISEETLVDVIHQQVQEAVLELFFWKEGSFEYRDCNLEFDAKSIKEINTMEIIMESVHRMDEWDEIRRRKEQMEPDFVEKIIYR